MQKQQYENKAHFYPKPKDISLIYVGEGRKVDNVPPRDLNPREVMLYGGRFYLTRTGLYVEPDKLID